MARKIPYGSWPSPVTAAAVSAASPRLEGARFVGDEIWWGESLPEEGGRTAVRRRRADGYVEDVLPFPWNARSRVHEYGGGSWTASDDGRLFFVEKADQRIWAASPGEPPVPLTAAEPGVRFGGLSYQEGVLLAVREIHGETPAPRRDVVSVATRGLWRVVDLTADSDFVAQPALSPGGRHLAWVAWNHPDMPWDRTELRVGRMQGGIVAEWTTITTGATSSLQPVWTDADDLLYLDDQTGRWNIWRMHLDADLDHEDVAPADADTGGPLWVLGSRWYAPLQDGRIVAVRTNGSDDVVLIDPRTRVSESLGLVVTANAVIEDASGSRVLVSGSGAATPPGIWLVDVEERTSERIAGTAAPWGDEWMPQPRAVTFDGPHGPVHAFDFPPTHPDVEGPVDARPPYVVLVHGGPTSHVAGAASGKVAFFTSRGIGVLDVNYGGSTGYGRDYRERLRGQWGVVDVDDVAAAAAGLAGEGRADAARLAIEGGSAGGWTVLAALVGTDVFSAGISRYGVGDARALAEDTHDFEAHYLDGLIGPLPAAEEVYSERSPLSRPERFRVPLLLLQGADDEVVPPSQSESIRDALVARGVPHAYVLYEGEGHGFRKAETVIDVLEKSYAFLGQVFGFDTPGVPALDLTSEPGSG
ncbi:prolyl oligopeptidase family serine peptidase [Microbacterium sp. BK668]|uniref:prolyl oligopeptidase family serine peptidase n=1 Tax=Microbacterium sp. BK668 TaxID=2512118 RepID=UPI00105DBC77|nr:prolyl oligopeptidase family serine peptidase [Microbacterium sp. BK668]TDN88638.1 dipeptidyl aminopeptidase/acylaminoacyl peptidase [Microbacterium sp. BK668]